MNGIRKIVSGWLAICLLLAMLPMNAFAMEATAEESVLYEALPNTYEQPATGTVKVTEDVRFVEQEEDGSFSSRNGTVTKEYALPGLPNVPKMAEHNDQNSTSPVDNAYGNLTFSTFEELKALAAGTYTEYTCAEYVGAGALEISESMRFPENLHINVFSYEIIVPAWVELVTTGWIRTARLVVDGVAHINSLSVGDALTVNGTLYVGNGIYIQDHTVVSGEENVYSEYTPIFYIEKTASTCAELEALAAKAKDNPNRGYNICIFNSLIITSNITLPWNCYFYVDSGVAVTVSAGCTLELDAYTDIAGILYVLGSLVNNSWINVNYDLGGRVILAYGSSYTGNGGLVVFSEYIPDPSPALSGLVLSNFEITEYRNPYYNQRYFELIPQMGDNPEPDEPTNCEVTRLYGDIRYRTAIKIADELKATWGVEKFNTIVVASGDDFPDALAGTYLASAVEAPIVLNSKAGYSFVAEYIQQNLAKNGKIYLLGGTAALQESVEARMKKITPNVVRLAGADRYATCLEILKEAAKYETVSEVMICSGVSYTDTLIASATAHPVLLVYGGASMLNQNQKAYLAGKSHTIVGDEATVGTKIATALSKVSTSNGRIAGDTCVTTSIAVAETYFPVPTTAVLASGKDYPDGLCGGVLAIAKQSPLLLVADQDDIIADYIATNNIQTGIIVGGSAAVSRDAVTTIFGVVEPEEVN